MNYHKNNNITTTTTKSHFTQNILEKLIHLHTLTIYTMAAEDDKDQPIYNEYKLFPTADDSSSSSTLQLSPKLFTIKSIFDSPLPTTSHSSQQTPPQTPALPGFLKMCKDAKVSHIQDVIDQHFADIEADTSETAPASKLRSLDHQRFSALHYAVLSGNSKCLQLIVSIADHLPEDDRTHPLFYCTALHLACKLPATTPDMVRMLIRQRPEQVNWTCTDAEGRRLTPLLAAMLGRRTQLVRVLCEEGQADVNAVDANGEHCLFYAVRQRMPRLACDLLRTTAVRANVRNASGLDVLDVADACCTAGKRDAADWQLLEALTSRLHSAVMLTPDIRRQLDLRALFGRLASAVRRKDDAYVAWFVGTYYVDDQWNSGECAQLVQDCLKLSSLKTPWRYGCGELLLLPLHRQLQRPDTCCEDATAADLLLADLTAAYGQMLLCPERQAAAAFHAVLYAFWREDALLYGRFAEQWFPVFGRCGTLLYRQDGLVTFLCRLAHHETAASELDGLFEYLMGLACGQAAAAMRMGDVFERFVWAGDDGEPMAKEGLSGDEEPGIEKIVGVLPKPRRRDNRRAELIAGMLLVLCDRIDPFERLRTAWQPRVLSMVALLVPPDQRDDRDRSNAPRMLFALCRRRVRELVLGSTVDGIPPVSSFLRLSIEPELRNRVIYNPLDFPIGCCFPKRNDV